MRPLSLQQARLLHRLLLIPMGLIIGVLKDSIARDFMLLFGLMGLSLLSEARDQLRSSSTARRFRLVINVRDGSQGQYDSDASQPAPQPYN